MSAEQYSELCPERAVLCQVFFFYSHREGVVSTDRNVGIKLYFKSASSEECIDVNEE